MSVQRVRKRTVRKNGKSKLQWIAEIAQLALATANGIKLLVNTEVSIAQWNLGLTAASVTGTVIHLSPIAQGLLVGNRRGNSILARNLRLRFTAETHASATEPDVIRLIVFADTEHLGANPLVTSLLTTATYMSLANVDNRDRFKVFLDKEWAFGPGHRELIIQEFFIRLYFHITFYGAATTNVNDNALYALVISRNSTNLSNYDITHSLTWTDN